MSLCPSEQGLVALRHRRVAELAHADGVAADDAADPPPVVREERVGADDGQPGGGIGVGRVGQLVCLESTTYPGTTDEVVLPRLAARGLRVGEDFFLAFSPEREDPGNT